MKTELALARSHLKIQQIVLFYKRKLGRQQYPAHKKWDRTHRLEVRDAEINVLAALSWLWDAQQRYGS